MNRFYGYVLVLLLTLVVAVVGLWYFALNQNSASFVKTKLISPLDFVGIDNSVSLSNKGDDNYAPSFSIDDYYILYSISSDIRYIPTAFLYSIGHDNNTAFKNPNKTSVYMVDVYKDNLFCVLVSENNNADRGSDKVSYKYSISSLKKFLDKYETDCNARNEKYLPIKNIKLINNVSSLNDKVLVSVFHKNKQGSAYAKNWDIYLLDINTNKARKLAKGIYPNWVSGSEFIYVSENGVDLFNINTNKTKNIYKFKNPGLDTYLSYSTGSNKFIWSFPFKGKVYLLSLVRNKNRYIGARLLSVIDKVMIKPLISDDGRYIVYLRTDADKFYSSKADKGYVFVYDIYNKKDIRQLGKEFNKDKLYSLLFHRFLIWDLQK